MNCRTDYFTIIGNSLSYKSNFHMKFCGVAKVVLECAKKLREFPKAILTLPALGIGTNGNSDCTVRLSFLQAPCGKMLNTF